MAMLFKFISSLLILPCIIKFDATASRHYCFTGSDLYAKEIVDCYEKDGSSYNGTWYCVTISICEPWISSKRQCIATRGCATEEECVHNGTLAWNGNNGVKWNDQYPGGMKIYPTCCLASDFSDDDSVSIDTSKICNSAPSRSSIYLSILIPLIMLGYTIFIAV